MSTLSQQDSQSESVVSVNSLLSGTMYNDSSTTTGTIGDYTLLPSTVTNKPGHLCIGITLFNDLL